VPYDHAGLAPDNGLARYYLAQDIPAYVLQVPTNIPLTVPDASRRLKPARIQKYSRTPLTQMLVNRIVIYPDRLGPSGEFVENSTKVACLETTGYRTKYSTESYGF
jgi:hypothetical protein